MVEETAGFDPVEETHRLSFEVFACDMAGIAGLRPAAGLRRTEVELALVGSQSARQLGGLLTRGLRRTDASYKVDAESLQKPVGGWSIKFDCLYGLRSDQPGRTEKE